MASPRNGTPTIGNEKFDVGIQRRVVELWGRKVPLADIARELGIRTWAVDRYIDRWLRYMSKPTAQRRRAQENESLDELERITWAVVAHPGYKVSASGRVVMEPQVDQDTTQQPVPDEANRLAAIGTLLRIQQRRARLNGLDAPAQLDVSVKLQAAVAAVELLEREADRQEAELRALAVETRSLPVGGTVTQLDIAGSS